MEDGGGGQTTEGGSAGGAVQLRQQNFTGGSGWPAPWVDSSVVTAVRPCLHGFSQVPGAQALLGSCLWALSAIVLQGRSLLVAIWVPGQAWAVHGQARAWGCAEGRVSRQRWPRLVYPEPHRCLPQVSGSWGALVLSWCQAGPSGHRGSLGQAAELLGVSVLATLSLRPQTQPRAGWLHWGGRGEGTLGGSLCPPFVQGTKANRTPRRVGRGVEVWAG